LFFKITTFVAFVILTNGMNAQLKVDTINALNNKLVVSALQETSKNYLVYFTDSSKVDRKTIGDIWKRSVKRSTYNNQSVFEFQWEWVNKDGLIKKTINICDSKTLQPIKHWSINTYGKTTDTLAYIFENGYMLCDNNVKGNKVSKDFKLKLDIPVLNWELDLETYSLFPIKRVGQIFDVSFFDPNEESVQYHRYEVVGEENLEVFKGTKVSCWLLKIQYDSNNSSTFWITKKGKEFIKSEEMVYTGRGYLVSIKTLQF